MTGDSGVTIVSIHTARTRGELELQRSSGGVAELQHRGLAVTSHLVERPMNAAASTKRELPTPPYYAVIFSSQRSASGGRDDGYGAMSERMLELAALQEGFLGVESARGTDGFGITVSYWRDEASIARWKADAEHLRAQQLGQSLWYESYDLRVAKVERAYGKPAANQLR
jgi:heme-degrading monooxygenase HmoA